MHKSCIHIGCMNHISNGLVQKMVEDIKINFFFPKYDQWVSIQIVTYELNKVHEMGVR